VREYFLLTGGNILPICYLSMEWSLESVSNFIHHINMIHMLCCQPHSV